MTRDELALRRLELALAAAHSAAELLVLAPIRMKDRDGAIQRARATATAARVRYVALAAEQRKASQPVLAI